LNIIAPVLGSSQQIDPALAGFTEGCEGKAQPCWYGIVPGVTTGDDVSALIPFAGRGRYAFDDLSQAYTLYFTPPESIPACVFTVRIRREIVVRIEISLCRRAGILLGDAISLWNEKPLEISLPPHDLLVGSLSFNANDWPSPSSPVYFINLLSRPEDQDHYSWHGFVPLWRYCQLEPDYPRCR
jgi:hypothetical protein